MSKKDEIWLVFMRFFSKTCHQKADRSFFFYNYQFPICARCTGLLIGYIFGIISILFNLKISILLSLFLIFIMFIDWFMQHIKIFYSTNIRRLLTGLFCGFGIINILSISFTKILMLF